MSEFVNMTFLDLSLGIFLLVFQPECDSLLSKLYVLFRLAFPLVFAIMVEFYPYGLIFLDLFVFIEFVI